MATYRESWPWGGVLIVSAPCGVNAGMPQLPDGRCDIAPRARSLIDPGVRAALICLFLVLIAAPAVVHAEDDKPWAAGVGAEIKRRRSISITRARRRSATATIRMRSRLTPARSPIPDHPAIRYNIAVCLPINLDRPVEALDNLEHAMRFGPAPLGPDLWRQAQMSQKLLAARVAEIEVTAEPGATVSLDGKPLGGPSQRVLTGDHQIVVEKPESQTETRAIRLNPGDHVADGDRARPNRGRAHAAPPLEPLDPVVGARWRRASSPRSVRPCFSRRSLSLDRYDAAVTTDCPPRLHRGHADRAARDGSQGPRRHPRDGGDQLVRRGRRDRGDRVRDGDLEPATSSDTG